METKVLLQYPRCFNTKEDYSLWHRGPRDDLRAAEHCTDCLPSYKMRMAKCGRCEHPETVFEFDPAEEGVEIRGSWKRAPVLERKPKAAPPQAPAMATSGAGVGRLAPRSAPVLKPAAAAPKCKTKFERYAPLKRVSHWDLMEAIKLGFEVEGSPTTAADMTDICRTDGEMNVSVQDVLRAMRDLEVSGVLKREAMFCEKRKCIMDHFMHADYMRAVEP
jgi:hypothetical protein